MNQNYYKHKRRLVRIEIRMAAIREKYPSIDFDDSEMRRDLQKYWKLKNELITASVDTKFCKSDDPDKMCSSCNCWKQTMANCS